MLIYVFKKKNTNYVQILLFETQIEWQKNDKRVCQYFNLFYKTLNRKSWEVLQYVHLGFCLCPLGSSCNFFRPLHREECTLPLPRWTNEQRWEANNVVERMKAETLNGTRPPGRNWLIILFAISMSWFQWLSQTWIE